MRYLLLLFVAISFISCSKDDTPLEKALKKAGENREELEAVLNRYKINPADSLKLKAAEFLIINMPWHYSYGGEYIENYIHKIDSALYDLPIEKRLILYSLPERYPGLKIERKPDINNITAVYLIHNIEKSFEVWENSYWLRELPFDDFCEYLLPYRLGREPLIYWKDSLRSDYIAKIENGTDNIHDIAKDSYPLYIFLKRQIFDDVMDYVDFEVSIPDTTIKKYKFDCITGSMAYAYFWRMCGIPASVDELPRWGNGNNYHADIAIIDNRSLVGFVPNVQHLYAAKVYRVTFSVNHSQLLEPSVNFIPPVARNPFYKDVTSQYVNTTDITIKPETGKDNPTYLYLGVFNLGWEAIAHAEIKRGKAIFNDLGVGVVYVPFYYRGNSQVFVSNPFYIDANRQVHYYNPDHNSLRTVVLDRKYKTASYKIWWSLNFENSRFEADNDINFTNPTVIHTIKETTYWHNITVPVNPTVSKRYYRIINKGYPADLAEIHFFDINGNEISGKIIGDKTTMENEGLPNINDNDLLSFAPFESWVGIDFGKEVIISRIEYLPRNDKNGIYPDMNYELFYFDKNRWVSMGVKSTTGNSITFENVPDNALLWLRNLTEGKEERIFTYENGKQIWF